MLNKRQVHKSIIVQVGYNFADHLSELAMKGSYQNFYIASCLIVSLSFGWLDGVLVSML